MIHARGLLIAWLKPVSVGVSAFGFTRTQVILLLILKVQQFSVWQKAVQVLEMPVL